MSIDNADVLVLKADERNLALEGDSAMASPARDAALTSHPVHATDTGGETA